MIRVVKDCGACPFCCKGGTEEEPLYGCNISTPALRLVTLDEERPTWCPLRKEQVIVREFA